jgi:hypothetical protein
MKQWFRDTWPVSLVILLAIGFLVAGIVLLTILTALEMI